MTTLDDPLGRELRELPVPPLDPALDAAVQRRARAALAEAVEPRTWWQRVTLGWQAAAVPALLLLTCAFYVVAAFQLMLKIYVG
jgi:hypothetical protein